MKHILFLAGVCTLLITSGCLVAEEGGHGREHHERHEAVVVGPPVLVVRPAEVIVR